MTERFVLERVPDFQTPMGEKLDRRAIEQLQDALRVSQRNFQKLERLMRRAILDGGLTGEATITLAMLAAAVKILSGDVTGTIGNTGATVVERIRGNTVDDPGASEDGKLLAYNHANSDFDWVEQSAGGVGPDYEFDTTTAAADPGAGKMRFNNATPASVTAIYLDDLLKSSAADFGTVLAQIAADDRIFIQQVDEPTKYILLKATGAPTDNTGWFTVNVTVDDSGTLPDNAGRCRIYVLSKAGGGGGASSPLTTKGDLWGYSSLDARVPIGTDGQVLTADSTQALGLKWAAAGGGSTPTLREVFRTGGARPAPILAQSAFFWDDRRGYMVTGGPTTPGINGTDRDGPTAGETERDCNECYDATVVANAPIGYKWYGREIKSQFGVLLQCDVKVNGATNLITFHAVTATILGSTAANPVLGHYATLWQAQGTDTFARFITCDGTTRQSTTTSVNLQDGDWHDIEIFTDDGGVTWYCYIDGVLEATHSTNVPGTTQDLGYLGWGNPHTSSGAEIKSRYSYFHLWTNWSGS